MGASFTVRLGEDLAAALRRASRESGVARGEIVRRSVAAHLKKLRRLSVMSQYFGAMQGPADLSTNKAYRRTWRVSVARN